ncbi:MAG: 1-acyl-sn-glycerol-3-phosphate acyltransferase, partial [Faecalibacillus sp.]
MIRIALVVLRVIYKIPYWWFYKLKSFGNRKKYPTIDEGYQFCHRIAKIVVKKARVDLECQGLENLPQDRSYLLTPNHQGLFDIVALFA